MKRLIHIHITYILIASFFLLIFPFLGMTEFLENIYVLIFITVIGYSAFRIRSILKGKKQTHICIFENLVDFFHSFSSHEREREESRKVYGVRKRILKKIRKSPEDREAERSEDIEENEKELYE